MASFLITAANSITQTGGTAGILDGNANNSLFVAAQGFIVQNGSADTVRFSFVGVTTHTIVVDGTIRSTGGAGLQLSAFTDLALGANGHISSSQTAVNTTASMTVNNAGTILGNVGISIGGDSATINNFGSIIATSTSQPAIRFTGGSAITSAYTVFNDGVISASSGFAITSSSLMSPPLLITNIGTILGGISNAQATANDRIENGGLIAGNITFGEGADTYDGRLGGTVDGNIDLGTGNDTFFGSDFAETVASSAGEDTFDFGGGNDTFTASASDGNDTIDGGAGVDTLDYSLLASLAFIDLSTGGASAAGSIDSISNFENIKATNGADQLIGNGASNKIEAFGGNDILDGRGAGSDVLDGGANNDTYIIDAGDRIIDASGIDLVQSSAVTLNLSSLGGGAIENAQLLGSANFNITGNAGRNVITGNAGKNTLTGGLEDDTFVFTTKLSSAKADRITDFNRTDDVMHLQNSGSGLFNGLANGVLAASRFKANAAGTATDSDDRIIYNKTTGDLFFDKNGSGAGGAIKFATLTTKPTITAADFFVI